MKTPLEKAQAGYLFIASNLGLFFRRYLLI